MNRHKELIIRTPEGIAFPLHIASPVPRFLAVVIDLICVSALTSIISSLLMIGSIVSPDAAAAGGTIATFVIGLAYPMALEWFFRGQTIGKKIMKLRVLDAQALKLHPSQIIIRNLLRPVDTLPLFYLAGGITSFINMRGQRIGDIAANTIVIQENIIRTPDLDPFFAGEYNSFLEFPHINARLRQNVSIREAGIMLQALMRRDLLKDDARTRLFHQLKTQLESKAIYPPHVSDSISDEQYVRNATQVIYYPRAEAQ